MDQNHKRKKLEILSALEAATLLTAEERKQINETPTADDSSNNQQLAAAIKKLFMPLLLACVLWHNSPAQSHHVAPLTVRGSEHPELISDERAWLMQLIASTSSAGDSEVLQTHAQLHRQALGLAHLDTQLREFRAGYDALIREYNANLKANFDRHGTTNYEQGRQTQLFQDIEQLVRDTVTDIQRNTPHWQTVLQRVRESKERMVFTVDPPAPTITPAVYHLRPISTTIGSSSAGGYTAYTALDISANGATWYQSVYLYGSSTGQWTCQWNSYQGMWEPPGCPASHSFYITNQINGKGYADWYEGTAWSPSQYVSFGLGNQSPVLNNGQETATSKGLTICSVAGTILGFYIKTSIMRGTTFFGWNGIGSIAIPGKAARCNLYPTCTNPGPWAINGSFMIDWDNGKCAPAYSCTGLCFRNPLTFVWTCPSDLTPAYCTDLWTINKAPCTPHP